MVENKLRYSSDVTLCSQAVYSRIRVLNSQAWLTSNAREWTKEAFLVISIVDNQRLSVVLCFLSQSMSSQVAYSLEIISAWWINAMWQKFWLRETNPRTNPWTLWWSMTWYRRLTCVIVSQTTPQDHLLYFVWADQRVQQFYNYHIVWSW